MLETKQVNVKWLEEGISKVKTELRSKGYTTIGLMTGLCGIVSSVSISKHGLSCKIDLVVKGKESSNISDVHLKITMTAKLEKDFSEVESVIKQYLGDSVNIERTYR